MLKAATLVCSAVEREGRPVLVHCSDGWDRTPQIVALAKILLDPFYRTLEVGTPPIPLPDIPILIMTPPHTHTHTHTTPLLIGVAPACLVSSHMQGFQVLVETEWLDYGHKFGDRCGHQENADDVSEQCPVFLQWLDCVQQLLKQFPCLFEFNEAFLVRAHRICAPPRHLALSLSATPTRPLSVSLSLSLSLSLPLSIYLSPPSPDSYFSCRFSQVIPCGRPALVNLSKGSLCLHEHTQKL